jgi:hypothetical protein
MVAVSKQHAKSALGLILAVTIAQFVFLTVGCDWELCGDEAEYWTWSRRLDWSYFSRGPATALIIRLGTTLAGSVSVALTGSLMPAVRLPALCSGALAAWGMFRLSSEISRRTRAGLIATLILPAVPLFRVGSLLMTSDTPLVCCWIWAAIWTYRGIVRNHLPSWGLAGLFVALGVSTKYTMLAFPAAVALFLLFKRPLRRTDVVGFGLLAASSGLGLIPIVVWNAAHGWVGAAQLADRVGLTTQTPWGRSAPLLAFLGGEAAVIGLWWLFGIPALAYALAHTWRGSVGRIATREQQSKAVPSNTSDAGVLFVLCLWTVIIGACVVASLKGEKEANWSAPADVTVIVVIAWWLEGRLGTSQRRRVRALWMIAFGSLWVIAMVGLTALQHSEWFYPQIGRWVPNSTAADPAPWRSLDPTCRMRGYRELVPEVQERLSDLRNEGNNPFVLAPTYTVAAELAFYLPGNPDVYCLSWSPGMADRVVNQHDLWHPNPRHDQAVFRGRPAVVVEPGTPAPNYARSLADTGLFAEAEPSARVVVQRRNVVVAAWDVTICRDYQGLPNLARRRELVETFSSSAYYQARGGTPGGWVRGLYHDLLGRSSSSAEEAYWIGLLDRHSRVQLVAHLVSSPEYRRRESTSTR